MSVTIHWFRRDLRLNDNTALNTALKSTSPVIPLFIFDPDIINPLPENDARISFIYQNLKKINEELLSHNRSLLIKHGDVLTIWQELCDHFNIAEVHFNRDYEPEALDRDKQVTNFLKSKGVRVIDHKDQVIFEANEVLKKDGNPYTVFTPYKKQWLKKFEDQTLHNSASFSGKNFNKEQYDFPSIESLGFKASDIKVRPFNLSQLNIYHESRDFPALDTTSYLSPHLRFGTISIRKVIQHAYPVYPTFISELIWREFFMQIMVHFPQVVHRNFREKYDGIKWRNNKEEFERWCAGKTGYPMVDAGMRQLNASGYMHNRVRMVTASFLCKHLLIDWRWGEKYFALKLLDFELASNNGNWQWAAGTGCDAAPYFRVFNPTEQQRKFDPDFTYIKKWVPEFGTEDYPTLIVEHKFARERAISSYKSALSKV